MWWGLHAIVVSVVVTSAWSGPADAGEARETTSVIAQGADVDSVAAAVEEVGGRVTRRLGIITAVAAEVTSAQLEELTGHPAVERIWLDDSVEAQEEEDREGDGDG